MENIEKVVDDIYWIGNNISLKFNVVLAKADQNRNRRSFHQQYQYPSSKYNDCNNLTTIKRHYDYFLTIENSKNNYCNFDEYIIINNQDFLFFRDKIKEASLWFSNGDIYRYKENNIIMVGNAEPIIINFNTWNKTISLQPIAMRADTGLICAGIRITLGKNSDNFADMTVDNYMGLVYVIDSFNMPMAAMTILSYLGKPENAASQIIPSSNQNNRFSPQSNKADKNKGRFVGQNNKPTLEDL